MITIELDSCKLLQAITNLRGLLGSPLSLPAVLGLIAQPLEQELDTFSGGSSMQLTCRY
jgi:hypothetical protein